MSLSEQLLEPEVRPAVVADVTSLVDTQAKSAKGLSGTALKATLAGVRKAAPNVVKDAVNDLLPQVLEALDPYWASFDGQGNFGEYLATRGDEVTASLLGITDKRVESVRREPIKKAYKGLRGKAAGFVKDALPGLGGVLQKHMQELA